MTITAHRVGRIPTPAPLTERSCWRCGIVFNPTAEHVTLTAPCLSCRIVLRAEGDKTIWNTRPRKSAA